MKAVLNIINLKKPSQLDTNSVIVYNGTNWYVTTTQDILKPVLSEINSFRNELSMLNNNYNKLANSTANSLKDMAELIKKDLEAKR